MFIQNIQIENYRLWLNIQSVETQDNRTKYGMFDYYLYKENKYCI